LFNKTDISKVDMFDYAFYGGYSHLPDKELSSKNQLEEAHDEKWPVKPTLDATIYTVYGNEWNIEFTYFANGSYSHDSLVYTGSSKTIAEFISEFQPAHPSMSYEVLEDESLEQAIIIFSNGTFATFPKGWGATKRNLKKEYLLFKIYSKNGMSDMQMKLLREFYNKMDS